MDRRTAKQYRHRCAQTESPKGCTFESDGTLKSRFQSLHSGSAQRGRWQASHQPLVSEIPYTESARMKGMLFSDNFRIAAGHLTRLPCFLQVGLQTEGRPYSYL